MRYQERLAEIEALVAQTFSLWNENRVGFSWRQYPLNHTLRVRALALELGRQDGANPDVVAYAATLHDLTKRYDGAILLNAEGKRVLDADGYWMTETLPPARRNRVTDLYDALDLASQMHHFTGALLAERILLEDGYPEEFCRAVAAVIRAHVTPGNATPEQLAAIYAAPEARVLHDADLIDANLGLVAFYRNMQIYAGRAMRTPEGVDPRAYVNGIDRWVGTKDSFLDGLRTASGRELARARQERNRQVAAWVAEESALGEVAWEYGLLGVVAYCLRDYEDPSLTTFLRGLGEEWLPERQAALSAGANAPEAAALLERARHFHDLLRAEVEGRL